MLTHLISASRCNQERSHVIREPNGSGLPTGKARKAAAKELAKGACDLQSLLSSLSKSGRLTRVARTIEKMEETRI